MLVWFLAAVCAALLPADPASANGGLTTSSFSSNELRTGFARLFRNGVEQPFPYSFLSSDFGTTPDPLLQQFRRPAPFGPQLSPTFGGRPRFYPPRGGGGGKGFGGGGGGFGGRRPNDVLVIVVKTNKNCTNEGNGTDSGNKPADGGGDDDEDDDDEEENQGGLNPDDEVESVNVVAGGAEGQKEPSRCVWAILACCAPANSPIRYTCFDVLGCSTAFWDTNPCVPEIVKAVLGQASAFLNGGGGGGGNGKGNETATTTPAPAEPPAEAASDNLAALASAIVASATANPLAVEVTPPSPPASAAPTT